MACSCMNNTFSSDGCLGSNNDEGLIKHCELQDSVNQQNVENLLLFRVIPGSMFASVSFVFLRCVSLRCHVFVFSCFNAAFVALTHVSWWCWTCVTSNIFFRSDVTCDQAAPVCIFKSWRHEFKPGNLLNLSMISEREENKLNSIPSVMANELG